VQFEGAGRIFLAPIAGSWRAPVKPVSMGPMNGLNAFERQNPSDRGRTDDSAECGGYSPRPCEALGGGHRPDVPQCPCAAACKPNRDFMALPPTPWPAYPLGGTHGVMSRSFVAALEGFAAGPYPMKT
jgi:hypothetical protein